MYINLNKEFNKKFAFNSINETSAQLLWLLIFFVPVTAATIILKWQGPKALSLVTIGAGLSILSTIVFGAYLAQKRKLRSILPVTGWGTLGAIIWYIFAMFYFNADGDSTDIAAGAGLAILVYPTAITIFALLVLGAVINKTINWVKNRF